jgi:hypothetical protein
MKWQKRYDGTEEMSLDSEFGLGCIVRYGIGSYRASVTRGNSFTDIHTESEEDAVAFVAHPFRTLSSGDYWDGSEIMKAYATNTHNSMGGN